ncbi:MAG: transposase [Duncaniella sp.]|nr:transposase [Duncaniella sp.]
MDSYSQINIMVVFSVKNRICQLHGEIRPLLYAAICKIVEAHGKGSRVVTIGGISDHIHILIGLSTTITIADLVREIKSRSSRWINENRLVQGHFEWQSGYGAFSYSQSARPQVINYIQNQEEHHRHKTFREELEALLKRYDVDFDPRGLPKE